MIGRVVFRLDSSLQFAGESGGAVTQINRPLLPNADAATEAGKISLIHDKQASLTANGLLCECVCLVVRLNRGPPRVTRGEQLNTDKGDHAENDS